MIDGPAKHGLDRANWAYAELADHLFKTRGIRVGKSALQAFGAKHGVRPYRPTYRFLRVDPDKQAVAREEIAALKKGREPGLVLLSQDEARLPMVPTLTATLGVKGHRPVVGTWDSKQLLYVFAVVNLATAALHANLIDSPKDATTKTGKSETRRRQEAFATHLRHVGRMCPATAHRRVVLLIDNAPWHAGEPVRQVLAEHPELELKRLPSYSPQLNPIERAWKVLRRRATHNRPFDTLADLRSSLSYFQTMRERARSLVNRQPRKRTTSAGS